MGPAPGNKPIPFRVFLDGQTADGAAGTDVAADGHGTVTDQRCYQLIRQRGPIAERRFEIEFLDAGVEAHCFTFG
jgi:Thioredoxin like C-terminal domain